MKIAKLVLWFIVFILIFDLGLNMISARNTIENIFGLVIIVANLYVSIKTKCFQTINFNHKKNEN